MGKIGQRAGVANRPHRVSLFGLGTAVPDGDGGSTQPVVALSPPEVWARIEPASQRQLERVASGTVISEASHVVTMPYHAQVGTNTVIVFNGRTFHVVGVGNPEERNIETVAVCSEVLNAPVVTPVSPWMQTDWIS